MNTNNKIENQYKINIKSFHHFINIKTYKFSLSKIYKYKCTWKIKLLKDK